MTSLRTIGLLVLLAANSGCVCYHSAPPLKEVWADVGADGRPLTPRTRLVENPDYEASRQCYWEAPAYNNVLCTRTGDTITCR